MNPFLFYSTSLSLTIKAIIHVVIFIFIVIAARLNDAEAAAPTLDKEITSMESCSFTKHAARGSLVEVELASPGGTGAEWFVELPSQISLISQGRRPTSQNTGPLGAPVMQWWKFSVGVVEKTTIPIHFFLYRRWEGKEKAFKHCSVTLIVQ